VGRGGGWEVWGAGGEERGMLALIDRSQDKWLLLPSFLKGSRVWSNNILTPA